MAAEDVPGTYVDLYGVLGLSKECSDADLRLAYRRLAMTWHPDRCSATGSTARVEEAKKRFQEIQGAYSVLSDSGKRLLYDVGVYDSSEEGDDGQEDPTATSSEEQDSGMGDFLGEMAEMMSQVTPAESFEELQQLFVDLVGGFGFSGPPPTAHQAQARAHSEEPCAVPRDLRSLRRQYVPPTTAPPRPCNGANKRCSSSMGSGRSAAREETSTGGWSKKQRPTSTTSHGVLFGRG